MPEVLSYASPNPQINTDDPFQLKAIAITHDILGALGIFPPIIGLIASDDPSMKLPLVLMLVGSLAIGASGICIHTRRLRVFSIIVAALLCLMFPIGTILGISTLRVLSRESVAAIYRASRGNL